MRDPELPTACVTTTDTCSNCGAKLTNAETSRLDYQGEAFRLAKELERVKAERDKALAACAEMRESLEKVLEVADFIDDETGHHSAHIEHALSSDCGKGWLPPEVAKELLDALKEINATGATSNFTLANHHADVAKQALAHAKERGVE